MTTKKSAISRFPPHPRRRSDPHALVRPAGAAQPPGARVVSPPRSVLERPVFSIAGRIFRWQDVLDAGRHWGDLAVLERQAQEGVAALDRAATTGPPIDEAEIESEEDV